MVGFVNIKNSNLNAKNISQNFSQSTLLVYYCNFIFDYCIKISVCIFSVKFNNFFCMKKNSIYKMLGN